MSVFDQEAGTKCFRLLSAAATDNATQAVSRPCAMKGIQGYNAKSSAVYLKLYDETATPVSTDTPVKTIYLPGLSAFALDFSEGFVFANALGFRLTGAVSDNDATALVAGDILALNIDYV
jgi:hypothetical protein